MLRSTAPDCRDQQEPRTEVAMTKAFDAIVVGARCAGSPTAMLLARKGYRVLVVDRATFPSDTVSTHILHPLGVRALSKMGPSRSPGGDRMPADPHLRLRLRSLHDCWRAGHERSTGRVLPAADDTRQAARRCSGSIRRGDPRRLRRRGGPDRGRTCGRHKGPLEAWRLHHRARASRRRRRRQTLVRGRGGSARTL